MAERAGTLQLTGFGGITTNARFLDSKVDVPMQDIYGSVPKDTVQI